MTKLFLVAAVFAPVVAVAEGPCKADREKFCKDVKPGGGAVVKCMREHKDQLSGECKASWESRKAQRKEVREACQDDVETLCGEVKPGKGRIIRCLKENEAKVSAACKTEMAEMKAHKRGRAGRQ